MAVLRVDPYVSDYVIGYDIKNNLDRTSDYEVASSNSTIVIDMPDDLRIKLDSSTVNPVTNQWLTEKGLFLVFTDLSSIASSNGLSYEGSSRETFSFDKFPTGIYRISTNLKTKKLVRYCSGNVLMGTTTADIKEYADTSLLVHFGELNDILEDVLTSSVCVCDENEGKRVMDIIMLRNLIELQVKKGKYGEAKASFELYESMLINEGNCNKQCCK